jgi:glycosyltransferase involved in cell wall biosynthesis
MTDLTVIICAHNPRRDYLLRTLDALKNQTLPREQWELLLVDNASSVSVSTMHDLSWHPLGRHLSEEELGLTPARLCGIREAASEVLVFVDDDNVLAPDYLFNALTIGKDFPKLGAWGGQKHPEFECQPPDWTRRYWRNLAIVEFDRDEWSNFPHGGSLPCGAGMCVRKSITLRYAELLDGDILRKQMDRTGSSLMSGGDTDLVYFLYKTGFGTGLFTNLNLTHLIGSNRTTIPYLSRLCESMAISDLLLDHIHGQFNGSAPVLRTFLRYGRALISRDRPLRLAILKGERLGRKKVLSLMKSQPGVIPS